MVMIIVDGQQHKSLIKKSSSANSAVYSKILYSKYIFIKVRKAFQPKKLNKYFSAMQWNRKNVIDFQPEKIPANYLLKMYIQT